MEKNNYSGEDNANLDIQGPRENQFEIHGGNQFQQETDEQKEQAYVKTFPVAPGKNPCISLFTCIFHIQLLTPYLMAFS